MGRQRTHIKKKRNKLQRTFYLPKKTSKMGESMKFLNMLEKEDALNTQKVKRNEITFHVVYIQRSSEHQFWAMKSCTAQIHRRQFMQILKKKILCVWKNMINLSVCVSYEGMRNKVLVYLNIYIVVKRKLNENNDL